MSRISRQTLVPGLAFAFVLILALAVTSGTTSRPRTRLHRAVRAYAAALADGDAVTAGERRADRDPGPEALRARAFRGGTWAVHDIDLLDGGTRARVTVLWTARDGRRLEERQVWVRVHGADWAFVALDR